MIWSNTVYMLSIIITAVVMAFVAWYSHRNRRDVEGAGIYMWVALLVCVFAFFEGMSLTAPSVRWARFWFNMRYACLAVIPVVWLVFVLQYVGKARLISKTAIAALSLVPCVTMLMILTNSMHGLWVFRDVGFHAVGPFYIVVPSERVPGIWYIVHMVYSYTLMMAGVLLVFIAAVRIFRRSQRQALALGAGTIIMVLGSLLPSLGFLSDIGINPMLPALAVGSFIIALAVHRFHFLGSPSIVNSRQHINYILLVVFVILTAGFITTGYIYYRHYEEKFRTGVEFTLSSIVTLKVGEIVRWREERLGDASILYKNDVFTSRAVRIYSNTADTNNLWRVRLWLDKIRNAFRYDRIMLLDERGVLRLSVPGNGTAVEKHILQRLADIRRSKTTAFIDFFRETPDAPIRLAVVAPVMYTNYDIIYGFVVLLIDPEKFLYPLIMTWPTPSYSAETLLVRREGNSVLFLNDLRFKNKAALNFKIPLTDVEVPAVKVVQGNEGVYEGPDYRGVPVVAATRAIPGTPWSMVARMDVTEVYAPMWERLWVLVVLVISLLAGSGMVIWMLWRRQGVLFLREKVAAAEALMDSEEKFSRAFQTSPYAITITRPGDGQIINVNDAFISITGYTREEVVNNSTVGMKLWANDADRDYVVMELMSGRTVAGKEFIFRKKNGEFITGLFAADILPLKEGRVILSSINDITERKQGEEALRETRDYLDSLINYANAPIITWDPGYSITRFNRAAENLTGYAGNEVLGMRLDMLFPRENLEISLDTIARTSAGEYWDSVELPVTRKDGTIRTVLWNSANVYAKDGATIVATIAQGIDITDRKNVEYELRESEEKFRSIFEFSTIGKSLTAIDGRLIKVNKAFADMLDYTIDELQKINFAEITHPDDLEKSRESIRCLLAREQNSYRLEKRYFSKKGNIVWGDVSTMLHRGVDGTPEYLITSIVNITERKLAEKELQESQANFKKLMESIPLPVCYVNKDGVMTFRNDRFVEIFGYNSDEVPTTAEWWIHAYPDESYRKWVVKNWNSAVQRAAATGEDIETDEYRVTCKDGTVRQVLISGITINDDFLATFFDITERKRAEDALRTSESRLKEAQEMAHLGYWIWDVTTGDVEWSEEVYKIFRRDPREFTPHIESILALSPWPEDNQRDRELITRAVESREPGSYEQKFLRPDNSVGYYFSNFQGNYDENGALVSIMGTIYDITDRKLLEEERRRFTEELERSNVDLQQFAYVASHDLQEPLRMISSYLQLIERRYRDRLDADANDFINFAVDGANRLQLLINGLLEYSRVKTHGKNFESVDVREVLDETCRSLELQIADNGAVVEYDGMPVITADRTQIARLFQNLIQNAIKFKREGVPPRILITASNSGNEHIFSVSDNGIGIESQYFARIFTIFQRLHTQDVLPGTGIGLAVCKRIIERHDGRIWVESSPGEGTSFYFSIPVHPLSLQIGA